MLSDDFKSYSLWNGEDSIPENDKTILINAIAKAHRLKKKVRFWDAPDNKNAWQAFMQLHVDYINTDHIKELTQFFRSY
jgi:alkaline phosphatase